MFVKLIISLAVFFQVAVSVKTVGLPKTWQQFDVQNGKSMDSLYTQYKQTFQKDAYSAVDEKVHFNLFAERVRSVFDWNSNGTHSYTKGINKFSDMTTDERRHYIMPERQNDAKRTPRSVKVDPKSKPVKGAGDSKVCDLRPFTTAVKNQASCGSCWAFGTMAAAEASHFLWSQTDAAGNAGSSGLNNAWQLSEQVLIECCDAYDCNGCGGGGAAGPMQCAKSIGALPSTVSHPYLGVETNVCAHQNSEAGAYVSEWFEPCNSGDEVCLKSYLGGDSCETFFTTAFKTSIQVIDSFYDYDGGVYSDDACPTDKHNHSVGIVGWGTSAEGEDYWIIRNSWGPDWATGGYMYMARGSNTCCVACDTLFFQ